MIVIVIVVMVIIMVMVTWVSKEYFWIMEWLFYQSYHEELVSNNGKCDEDLCQTDDNDEDI